MICSVVNFSSKKNKKSSINYSQQNMTGLLFTNSVSKSIKEEVIEIRINVLLRGLVILYLQKSKKINL